MAKPDDLKTQPRSEVLLELLRLDVGSAVALVGHPIHVMMVHFPIAFVIATLGVDVFYWWSGDAFWVRVGLLVGRHGLLERRGRKHRRHRRAVACTRHPAS